jgi:hypothetical protein
MLKRVVLAVDVDAAKELAPGAPFKFIIPTHPYAGPTRCCGANRVEAFCGGVGPATGGVQIIVSRKQERPATFKV